MFSQSVARETILQDGHSQHEGLDPLGVKRLFHKGCLRPLESTDVYIMIHNRSKITIYEAAMKMILWLRVHHGMRYWIKELRTIALGIPVKDYVEWVH